MIFESRHRRFLAEINVIPLVDVVLVLLIIFMVTAPMLHRGLDINLPKSGTTNIKAEERLVVSIGRDQKLYLDNDPISVQQLKRRLTNLQNDQTNVSVYLRADREVPYGIVVQVMDGVKQAGIEKLGMVTEPSGVEQVTEDRIQRKSGRRSQKP